MRSPIYSLELDRWSITELQFPALSLLTTNTPSDEIKNLFLECEACPLYVSLQVFTQFNCRLLNIWHMPLLGLIFVAKVLILVRTLYFQRVPLVLIDNYETLMLFLPLFEQGSPGRTQSL